MVDLIGSFLAFVGSLIAAWSMVKKKDQDQDIKFAVMRQAIEDRLDHLEEWKKNQIETEKRLASMEKTLIEIKKDVEYLKKGVK